MYDSTEATITIFPPAGYKFSNYIVLVDVSEIKGKHLPEYAVTVLAKQPDDTYEEVEEVGCGPLSGLMQDAARIIRTGTAVQAKR